MPGDSDTPEVVFIMGAARSGSTLLGVLIGQPDDVFYAGELCDWAERDGFSSIDHSQEFWKRIRERVGPPTIEAHTYKRLFEHPAGLGRASARRSTRVNYERMTWQVLCSVADESGCAIVVDSSHYPRRARALRRLLGERKVRLVYLVRRPSSVARSFQASEYKGALSFNLYLMVVSLLSWAAYLTHPRSNRVIVSYESLTVDPLEIGAVALGHSLEGVDPGHLQVPPILTGNRFVRSGGHVAIEPADSTAKLTLRDRLTDLIQLPTWIALRSAGRRIRPAPPTASLGDPEVTESPRSATAR
jgi:Sulfotransferase family